MGIFKTRTFERWCEKAGITDAALIDAVANMEQGLIDAQLGGNLFKQRVTFVPTFRGQVIGVDPGTN